MSTNDSITKRLDGENEEQYIWRICQAKDLGELDLDWNEIAKIINEQFRSNEHEYLNESSYRKPYRQAKRFFESGVFSSDQKYAEEIKDKINELKQLKQQISDERVDYQRTVREEARKISFITVVEDAIKKHVEPFEYHPSQNEYDSESLSDDDMIVCLSDLRAGIECSNYWNVYNSNVMRQRLNNYIDEIRNIQSTHKCRVCELVLGGDNISGIIHKNLRLENNENVIEQVKLAAVCIGGFIDEIRKVFEVVNVHSISGNHSRIMPDKNEHVTGEELDDLIPFILDIMFSNVENVNICGSSDDIDSTFKAFRTRGGKLIYYVHGDKDTPSSVLTSLTLMTGYKPDAIIMSHRHHNAYDSQHGTKIIQTGSVVGTDTHCKDLRISGNPEQAVVITSAKRAVKCIYDVGLE